MSGGAKQVAAKAGKAAVREAVKVAVAAPRRSRRPARSGLLQRLRELAAAPFRAAAGYLVGRVTELSSMTSISTGLVNYVMIVGSGGSQQLGAAAGALCAIPALFPDGTFSVKKSRRRRT